MLKSLEHLSFGPVGLIRTQKVGIKYKKPLRDTWQKKDLPLRPNRGSSAAQVPIDHLAVRILPAQPGSAVLRGSIVWNPRKARQWRAFAS